jgi:alanyl-tRNA synthetase
MGEEACTIDLEGRDFDEDIVTRAEDLANAVVCENRPVLIRNVTPADLKDLELRRALPDGVTDVRLIDVENFDVIPCCGTHVKRTGELGLIKVLRHENIKGTRRVYFKVGGRAYKDYIDKHTIVQHLANRFTTSADGINAKVDKLSAQLQLSKKDVKRLSKRLAAYEIADLVESASDCNGKKLIIRFFPDSDDGYLRTLSSGLKAEPNVVVILGTGNGTVVCSASDGVAVDFSLSAVPMANAAGGSGGGKGTFAQIKLPTGIDVKEFLIKVGDNVQKTLS